MFLGPLATKRIDTPKGGIIETNLEGMALLYFRFKLKSSSSIVVNERRGHPSINLNFPWSSFALIVSSSTIGKMFEIFQPIFEQNAKVNFVPIFEKMYISVLFW